MIPYYDTRRKYTCDEIFDLGRNNPKAPFLKVCAPMVRYSKLPFRKLVRNYGVDVVYTPMILADVFANSQYARDADFSTDFNEGPVIVQFAANDPQPLVRASQLIYKYVDGIDINCGCPQSWAIGEGIGSYLLREPEKIRDMVYQIRNQVPIPCSIKIRLHKDLKETLELVKRAEQVGVAWITVHGRLVKQKPSEPPNLEAIKFLKENLNVPVIANGDVFSLTDSARIIEQTKVDGVMAARGLLENPAMFSENSITPLKCVEEYIRYALDFGTTTFIFHHHIMFMLEKIMSKSEKKSFNVLSSIPAILDHLREHYNLDI